MWGRRKGENEGAARRLPDDRYACGIAAKPSNVVLNPPQCCDDIEETVVAHESTATCISHCQCIQREESCNTESVKRTSATHMTVSSTPELGQPA